MDLRGNMKNQRRFNFLILLTLIISSLNAEESFTIKLPVKPKPVSIKNVNSQEFIKEIYPQY